MTLSDILLIAGVVVMAWGGASVASLISAAPVDRRVPRTQRSVAVFAVGILLIANGYTRRVAARIDTLEREVATLRASTPVTPR